MSGAKAFAVRPPLRLLLHKPFGIEHTPVRIVASTSTSIVNSARLLNTRTVSPLVTPLNSASIGFSLITAGGGKVSPNMELTVNDVAGVISVSGCWASSSGTKRGPCNAPNGPHNFIRASSVDGNVFTNWRTSPGCFTCVPLHSDCSISSSIASSVAANSSAEKPSASASICPTCPLLRDWPTGSITRALRCAVNEPYEPTTSLISKWVVAGKITSANTAVSVITCSCNTVNTSSRASPSNMAT
ncbi:unannotated protein [freshwater metagenome]|uniref:Unannotated protein n=1 Tax=freshwater metagenome TaxID=449393 RepID=A0A6J6V1P7_9ZZZZ